MDDARGRRNHAKVPESLLAPAQELVALAVALKLDLGVALEGDGAPEEVHLHGVIDHQIDRDQGINLCGVAAQASDRRPHCGQIHDGWHSREILQDHPRRLEGHFPRRRRLRVPLRQRRDIFLRHQCAVAVSQQSFQQDFDRKRQAGKRPVAGRFQAIQAVYDGASPGSFECGSRPKNVLSFFHGPSASPACHDNAETCWLAGAARWLP